MTNLTKNEKLILAAAAQDFNYDTAEAEKGDNAVVFTVAELSTRTGKSEKSAKGIVGSLFKKGLLCEMPYGEAHELGGVGVTSNGIDAFYAMGTFTNDDNSGAVVVWYDASPDVKSWTVILSDAEGNQQGEAIHTAQRADAMNCAEEIVREHNLTGYNLTNSKGVVVDYTLKSNGKFKKAVTA